MELFGGIHCVVDLSLDMLFDLGEPGDNCFLDILLGGHQQEVNI